MNIHFEDTADVITTAHRRLWLSVILKAKQDALEGDRQARRWLTKGTLSLRKVAYAAGLNADQLLRVMRRTLK